MRTKSAQSKLNTMKRGFRYLRGGTIENVWRSNWQDTFNAIESFPDYKSFQIIKKDGKIIEGSALNSNDLIESIKYYILSPDNIDVVFVSKE